MIGVPLTAHKTPRDCSLEYQPASPQAPKALTRGCGMGRGLLKGSIWSIHSPTDKDWAEGAGATFKDGLLLLFLFQCLQCPADRL